jgi:hypothetical protein
MEITGPNEVKITNDEHIYELIKLIKHKYENVCHFYRGPLWKTAERKYNDKLVWRSFHLINHHIYELQERGDLKIKKSYWRVSGRGNVNPLSREEAIEIISKRTDYVEDSDLGDLGPNDDPEIPYRTPNCDF